MYKRFVLLALLFACALMLTVQIHSWAAAPKPATRQFASTTGTTAQALEQQGRSHYAAGRYSEAAIAFRQAAQAYQARGDVIKQATSLSNLSLAYQQLGQWTEAERAITDSLTLLTPSPHRSGSSSSLAQAFNIQARLQLAQGKTTEAYATWELAVSIYQQLGDKERASDCRINQAQVLQTAGNYRRAIAVLAEVLGIGDRLTDPPSKLESFKTQLSTLPKNRTTILALQSLGDALRVTGNLPQAEATLHQSLADAKQLNQPDLAASALLKLGNLTHAKAFATLNFANLTLSQARDLIKQNQQGRQIDKITSATLGFNQFMQDAQSFYEQAAAQSTAIAAKTQAQLNQLSVLIDTAKLTEANTLLPSLQIQVESLPLSTTSINARINLAQSLIKWAENSDPEQSSSLSNTKSAAMLLSVAIQQAHELKYQRAESYALGSLGHLYEQQKQWWESETVTRQALTLAQSIRANDLLYLWQWQLGRSLKAQGKAKEAIAHYQGAIATLKLVRRELVNITPDEQFSFRDTIEPIHREFVALVLDTPDTANQPTYLKAARNAIEDLQLSELVDFFREDCLSAIVKKIEQTDPTAAVIYPIILGDRLAIIASLPGQSEPILTYRATTASTEFPNQLETTINHLRLLLQQENTAKAQYLPPAEQLYDWLIRPLRPELDKQQIKTLVFVLDGDLRNIPMAVLHDHTTNQYLIDQYSIALTPGLQLLGTQPLSQQRLKAFVAGISEGQDGLPPLPNVKVELEQIQAQIPNSQVIANQAFTKQAFQANIRSTPFPIVHLATHGKFSSKLEETFISTWSNKLTVNELQDLLRATELTHRGSLELLVLSACETAKGDRRAALGLAGVAVRSGARSTLATLWQVNDESSAELMGQFYRQLTQPNTAKADALRQAQLALKNSTYQHPYYWSPYVLIGNWQ